jgi:hypothetical protein
VWIGGPERPDLNASPPPGAAPRSTTTTIDLVAAQVIFNNSPIPIWQVPGNAGPADRPFEDRFAKLAACAGPRPSK